MSRSDAPAIQYASFEHQRHAARLGMWIVLVSEVLLFGGLFTLYAAYRTRAPHVFAEAAGHTDLWLSVAMTYLLLTSSLFVALGVDAIRHDRTRAAVRWNALAIGLGLTFLAVKFWEYARHFGEGIYPGSFYAFEKLPSAAANAFFSLYYCTTGLHALHVAAGLGLLGWALWLAQRRRVSAAHHVRFELAAMYWHLVDALWLFIWPLYYLLR